MKIKRNLFFILIAVFTTTVVVSCSVTDLATTGNYNANNQKTFLSKAELSQLEKEYKSFSTKALSDAYVSRMFSKFLTISPNPTQVIRQLEFARYLKDIKSDSNYFNSLKTFIGGDSSKFNLINNTNGVPAKKTIESATFGAFVDSLNPNFNNIVTSGLLLNLDAGNIASYPGNGITWNDLSGNGNNGILTNGPLFSSANNGSLVFDGLDDYADFGKLSFLPGLSKVSIEAWFYNTHTPSNWQNVFGQFDGSNGWAIHTSNIVNEKIMICVGGGSSYGGINEDATGKWVQVGLIFDGTLSGDLNRLKIYLNGIQKTFDNYTGGSVPSVFPNATGVNARIGHLIGYGRYFDGNISNVKIYSKALTPAEVLQNYNALKGRYGL